LVTTDGCVGLATNWTSGTLQVDGTVVGTVGLLIGLLIGIMIGVFTGAGSICGNFRTTVFPLGSVVVAVTITGLGGAGSKVCKGLVLARLVVTWAGLCLGTMDTGACRTLLGSVHSSDGTVAFIEPSCLLVLSPVLRTC